MSVLEAAIGWLAPPQCVNCGLEGQALCLDCSTSVIVPFGERCWKCGAMSVESRTCSSCRQTGSPTHVWITTTYDGLAQELVQKYKFGHQRAASVSLARLMTGTFLSGNRNAIYVDYLVIAIPTATSRVRQRGFDHAKLLAHNVSRQLRLECSSSALARLGQTRQVGSIRSDRLKQTNNYLVRNQKKIEGRKILLVDDVATTGATLQSVSHLLKINGASHVDGLVFAKRL